jgi:hypothetical protein
MSGPGTMEEIVKAAFAFVDARHQRWLQNRLISPGNPGDEERYRKYGLKYRQLEEQEGDRAVDLANAVYKFRNDKQPAAEDLVVTHE